MRTWGWDDGGGWTTWTSIHFATQKLPRDKLPHSDANDAQLEHGLSAVYAGLNAYHTQHGAYASQIDDLETDLAGYVTPWPTNPWTGGPMVAGPHRGDIDYAPMVSGVELGVNLGN